MFNKLMNNYYFGKSGKGDLTPDDLPENRWQLFLTTLRVRLSALVRLNLLYVVVWIPAIIVIALGINGLITTATQVALEDGVSINQQMVEEQAAAAEADGTAVAADQQVTELPVLSVAQANEQVRGMIMLILLALFPCIAITGPVTAGISYVTRNWARDEHAFIWSDFKDAVKENWKQSLVVSVITGALPVLVYVGWTFYSSMSESQPLMVVPQVLILMLGLIWALSVTYMHPMIVSYKLRMRDVIRNAVLIAIARLPMSVGIRLLHCVPAALFAVVALYISTPYASLGIFLWYLLLGLTISRFITASYTNGVFERFINSRIEGAPVNRGLRAEEDEDDEEEDGEDDA